MNWQSSRVKPPARNRATSAASATFEALVARLTMLSPKKARPKTRPYSPPTSELPCQHSIECACPVSCSRRKTCSIGAVVGRLGAQSNHRGEGAIGGHAEMIGEDRLAQRA